DPPFPFRPDVTELARASPHRFETHLADVRDLGPLAGRRFAAAALSNVVAYLSQSEFDPVLAELRSQLLPGAPLVYWDRAPFAAIGHASGFEVDVAATEAATALDRTWINARLVVARAG